jgi:SET domain-containing protein
MDRKRAIAHIKSWTLARIARPEREKFREIAEDELHSLHDGNFARFQIKPSEFTAWQNIWRK